MTDALRHSNQHDAQTLSCEECAFLLPLFVMGTLTQEEQGTVERHLEECKACRAEAQRYAPVAEALLYQVPLVRAPESVRQKVARIPEQAEPLKPRSFPSRQLRLFSWKEAWAIAATLALLLLAVWNVYLLTRWQTAQRQLAAQQEIIRLLTNPELHAVPLQPDEPARGARAVLYYLDEQTGLLIVEGLPPLDSNRAYQLWLIRPDGKRDNGGVFRPAGDQPTVHTVVTPAPWHIYTGVGVTIEPATGSPGPTGPRVLHGGL